MPRFRCLLFLNMSFPVPKSYYPARVFKVSIRIKNIYTNKTRNLGNYVLVLKMALSVPKSDFGGIMSNGSERIPEHPPDEETVDNLKEDYIWFQPGVNKRHVMQCTCGKFLESSDDYEDLIAPAIRHARKSGHTLNLRGN